MPLYEYRCTSCGKRSEILVPSYREADGQQCPHCGAGDLVRRVSRFAYHRSEADRLAEIDTSKERGEDYYRDDRNVGLWAKKRLQELGTDMGSDFDAIVEKAREETHEALSG